MASQDSSSLAVAAPTLASIVWVTGAITVAQVMTLTAAFAHRVSVGIIAENQVRAGSIERVVGKRRSTRSIEG